jgi:hypothetical protein
VSELPKEELIEALEPLIIEIVDVREI